MTRSKWFLQVIGSLLILLLVIGCGGGSSVDPQPGATFSGLIDIDTSKMGNNVTVDGGEIELTVTDDGKAITSTSINLINAACTNDAENVRTEGYWSRSFKTEPPDPITNGKFEAGTSEIVIKGNFTSATEANGTIEISTRHDDIVQGQYFTCDFGPWNWSATVK